MKIIICCSHKPHNLPTINSFSVGPAASRSEIYSRRSCHKGGKKKGSYKWHVLWWGRLQLCQLVLWDGWQWKLQSGKLWCTDLVWLLSHCVGPPVAVLLCHCWTLILHPPQLRVSVCRLAEIKWCDREGWCVFTAPRILKNLIKAH